MCSLCLQHDVAVGLYFIAYPTLKRGATCRARSASESQKAESELRFNLLAFLNLLDATHLHGATPQEHEKHGESWPRATFNRPCFG